MERIFHLKENGTTIKTEILAGLTTFMTMAYIIALNPNLLTNFAVGTPLWNGVFLATCIASAIGTVCMAFLANKPFVMAPGMGLNSFFAVIAGNIAAMLNTDYTSAFQAVLCIILVEGIVFLILSVFNIRDKIVHAIPLGVRLGTFLDDQFTRDPIISRIDQLGSVDPAMHTGRTPRSSYIYQALGKGKSDRNMEPFFIEIYPDKDEERKTISHQGEEFILVLKGELMVVYGRETYYLKAGETIYYNSIVPHYVGAHGDDPAQLLAVTYTP